jgi:hypothetical protein
MSFNKDYSVPAEGQKIGFLEDEVIKISTELAALQVYVRAPSPGAKLTAPNGFSNQPYVCKYKVNT